MGRRGSCQRYRMLIGRYVYSNITLRLGGTPTCQKLSYDSFADAEKLILPLVKAAVAQLLLTY